MDTLKHERNAPRTLPIQPLLDHLGLPTITEAAFALGVCRKSIHNWKHTGIDGYMADELCVAAGAHPITIYGQAWEDSLPGSDDPDAFDLDRSDDEGEGPSSDIPLAG